MSATLDEVLSEVKGVSKRLDDMGSADGQFAELAQSLDSLRLELRDEVGRIHGKLDAQGKRIAELEAARTYAGPSAGNGGG